MKLKKYKHYPLKSANEDYENCLTAKYLVTTINWTLATDRKTKKQVRDKVHKNKYTTNIIDLIDWIRDTEEVAEDIIKIEAVK